MATVYLHIGTPKTGTTSLQNFLSDNGEALNRHNICYPDFGFRYPQVGVLRNGHFLVTTKYRDEKNNRILEKERADYEKGLDLLEECAENYSKIILSDEGVWRASLYSRNNFWSNLKKDLEERQLDIKIIVYLRRQDLFIQSQWMQKVKERFCGDFKDYLAYIARTGYPLDYYEYLHNLERVFGKDALIVRVFEKGQFLGEEHTIHSDFLNIFGLKLSDGFQMNQEFYNQSLEGNYLELKRFLNVMDEWKTSKHPLLKQIQEVQNRKLFGEGTVKYTYFEEDGQETYLEQFRESNANVAREYLGRDDGILFYDAIKDMQQYSLEKEVFLRDTLVVYGKMFDALAKENQQLREKNRQLEHKIADVRKENREQIKELRQTMRDMQQTAFLFRLKRKTKHLLGKDKED